jgi:hypothetical protein
MDRHCTYQEQGWVPRHHDQVLLWLLNALLLCAPNSPPKSALHIKQAADSMRGSAPQPTSIAPHTPDRSPLISAWNGRAGGAH